MHRPPPPLMSPVQLTVFGRILMSQPGINVYDIRKQCIGPLCYDFSDADKYLNRCGHPTLTQAASVIVVADDVCSWQPCSAERATGTLVEHAVWCDESKVLACAPCLPHWVPACRVVVCCAIVNLCAVLL